MEGCLEQEAPILTQQRLAMDLVLGEDFAQVRMKQSRDVEVCGKCFLAGKEKIYDTSNMTSIQNTQNMLLDLVNYSDWWFY